MCTLAVPRCKIPFSQDSQIHKVKVRKSYFVPFKSVEWLETLHMARTDLELGKIVLNSLYVSWSVFSIAKYNYGRTEKSFANF